MTELKILIPEATTNYILNPAIRYDTDGHSAFNSSISRSLDYARFGIASLKVVTNGSQLHEGCYYRVSDLLGISTPLTVSAYVIGEGNVRIRLIEYPNGYEWFSRRVTLLPNKWTRIEVTGKTLGNNDVRLYVETDESQPKARTFYVDGFQMEPKAYSTTYCDGDQAGCQWNVVEQNSISTRSGKTRKGGKWFKLVGKEREYDDLYMTTISGLGMPPITINSQKFATLPGASFQSNKVESRSIIFTFHAKNKSNLDGCQASLQKLHQLRQLLLDIVKPDLTAGGEPFIMEYQSGEYAIRFSATYEGGLEGEWDIRNQWSNSFPLRVLSVSPMLYEDDQQVSQLGIRNDNTINYILQRTNGTWSGMNYGFNSNVLDLKVGLRGEIIAVGEFTVANNSINAISPFIPANRIAYWDGKKWNVYDNIGANGKIWALDVAPNGYIYVTGDFTAIGGVFANRAAYWDGVNWNALGSGINGTGYTVRVSPDGYVYFGGNFTSAGGSNAYYIAKWDGNGWKSMGATKGVNSYVYSIEVNADGSQVYFGGAFNNEYGNASAYLLEKVGFYDPSTNNFSDLGKGFNGVVNKLLITKNGTLLAVGYFTATSDEEIVFLRTAYWNGSAWFAYGVGSDDFIKDVDSDAFGNILLGGAFQTIGSDDTRYLALWNGSNFVSLDVEIDDPCYAVLYGRNGYIYAAPQGTNARWAKQTIINNRGSAETSPVIYMKGPLTLRWIENQTSQRRIYADLTVQENEEVFIDFAKSTIRSNIRGNLLWAISQGSDFRAFTLLPGDNVISIMALDDVNAIMQISYTPTHWSVDMTGKKLIV